MTHTNACYGKGNYNTPCRKWYSNQEKAHNLSLQKFPFFQKLFVSRM